MEASNYGMPAPAGYRTALRLMRLAERFHLPLVTLVDTCGAWPSFEAERDGQSEAIATNLTVMAGLKTPIVTLIVGEGGSGGALGIGMGNRIGEGGGWTRHLDLCMYERDASVVLDAEGGAICRDAVVLL
jgi:acetyl-CoA carboxylase alpha subunit